MLFIVGAVVVGTGLFFVWGAISGRLAKMLAAIFAPNELKTTAVTAAATNTPDSFQQLNIPSLTGALV